MTLSQMKGVDTGWGLNKKQGEIKLDSVIDLTILN